MADPSAANATGGNANAPSTAPDNRRGALRRVVCFGHPTTDQRHACDEMVDRVLAWIDRGCPSA